MSNYDADVIIIGSGFGGSISANRLAQAGLKVQVLERGPWRDSLPVRSMGIENRAPFPYGMKAVRHLLRTVHLGRRSLTLNKSGMYEVFRYSGLDVIAVSGVGGGSNGWLGMLTPPQDPGYWTGRHPDVNPKEIEKYYDKILADMGAVRFSKDFYLPHSIWTHLPGSQGSRCLPLDPQPYMAMKFPRTKSEIGQITEGEGGVKRQTCAFNGDGLLGSQGGVKASVDFIYLAPALRKGAIVRDMCEATKVVRDPATDSTVGIGYAVHFSNLRSGLKEVVRAKRIIFAAGTMHTLRLLFASSLEPDGLRPMPSLGRTFGGNGDFVGAWIKKSAQPTMFQTAPLLGCFKTDGQDTPFLAMASWAGLDTLPLLFGWKKKKLEKIAALVGMGADTGSASARFENGRVEVDYDPRQQPIFDKIRGAFRTLETESGMKTWWINKPITFHQWGGACLGPTPDRGVVDHHGEVYGNQGLFVADAAALPAAAGTPPSLTIAAWAHHVADSLAERAT